MEGLRNNGIFIGNVYLTKKTEGYNSVGRTDSNHKAIALKNNFSKN
jgi:hypothetical protein